MTAASGLDKQHPRACSVRSYSHSNPVKLSAISFKVTVPADASYTQPYFTRSNPETETVYTITDPELLTHPWSPYPVMR